MNGVVLFEDFPERFYSSVEIMWAVLRIMLRHYPNHKPFGVSSREEFDQFLNSTDKFYKWDLKFMQYLTDNDGEHRIPDKLFYKVVWHVGTCLGKVHEGDVTDSMFQRLAKFFVTEVRTRSLLAAERALDLRQERQRDRERHIRRRRRVRQPEV